jgi:positive regulator of sigma E activity
MKIWKYGFLGLAILMLSLAVIIIQTVGVSTDTLVIIAFLWGYVMLDMYSKMHEKQKEKESEHIKSTQTQKNEGRILP